MINSYWSYVGYLLLANTQKPFEVMILVDVDIFYGLHMFINIWDDAYIIYVASTSGDLK